MKTLTDLFENQLHKLYDGEKQMIASLPKVIEKTTNKDLKNTLENHLTETKNQKTRLEEISKSLNFNPTGKTCKGMKSLIEEMEDFLEEAENEEIKNAGIIANAQKIEHYEISGYGTAIEFAKELGHQDIAKKLQTSLKEENQADHSLTHIAEKRINKKAT